MPAARSTTAKKTPVKKPAAKRATTRKTAAPKTAAAPAAIDVTKMSPAEIREMMGKLENQLKEQQKARRKEGLDKIKAIMAEYDISADMLASVAKKGTTAGRKIPPQYQNPDNAKEQWSGRGRKPRWVEAQLAAGKELADLKIR